MFNNLYLFSMFELALSRIKDQYYRCFSFVGSNHSLAYWIGPYMTPPCNIASVISTWLNGSTNSTYLDQTYEGQNDTGCCINVFEGRVRTGNCSQLFGYICKKNCSCELQIIDAFKVMQDKFIKDLWLICIHVWTSHIPAYSRTASLTPVLDSW